MIRQVKSLLIIPLLLAGGYVTMVGALYLLQGSLIFHPQPPGPAPARDDVEPFALRRDGVTLRGWVVNPRHGGPLMVYYGGNAEEVSRLVGSVARLSATTVLVNYRGYGESEGSPAARTLIDDAAAVAEAARARLGGDRPLLLFGRSLGSGLAALTARQVPADGVILLSPYRSLTHLARRFAPIAPVDLLLRHRIDTTRALAALPDRVLVLYAPDDMIIPATESRALTALIRPPPEVVTFGGGHNVPLRNPDIWPAIERFVAGSG
jgi:pimeloyl-ACP methyl ester carboxylesterase